MLGLRELALGVATYPEGGYLTKFSQAPPPPPPTRTPWTDGAARHRLVAPDTFGGGGVGIVNPRVSYGPRREIPGDLFVGGPLQGSAPQEEVTACYSSLVLCGGR